MLCSRCKKRQAVVFISTIKGTEKRDEGLCLICAKELGVPQVNDYLEKMGISDDDLEETYKMLFGESDPDADADEGEDDDNEFSPGGAGTVLPFFQRFAAANNAVSNTDGKTDGDKQNVKDEERTEKKKISRYLLHKPYSQGEKRRD